MNIIIETDTNIVKYAGDEYILLPDKIEVHKSGVLAFIIGDMNASTAVSAVVDSIPEDYVGGKYLYVGEEFISNPVYNEPEVEE